MEIATGEACFDPGDPPCSDDDGARRFGLRGAILPVCKELIFGGHLAQRRRGRLIQHVAGQAPTLGSQLAQVNGVKVVFHRPGINPI